MKKGENFYRRDPSKALSGMIGLTLEERGVYNTVLDLLYSTWRPLEDDRPFLANWCGCAVQKLNPIIRRLIEKGRLITFEEGGRTYLSDEAFEAERASVKGVSQTRSGRGQVKEKSGEVEEKSAGVEENPSLLYAPNKEKQGVTTLEKNREEKNNPPTPQEGETRRKPKKPIPDGFPDAETIAEHQAKARLLGANVDIGVQAERFRNWAIGKDARYADWAATFRNWCGKAIENAPKTPMAALAKPCPAGQDEVWRRRVREFKSNRYWPTDDLGPCPGRPGCRAPVTVLAEFGLAPRPANDAPLLTHGAAA